MPPAFLQGFPECVKLTRGISIMAHMTHFDPETGRGRGGETVKAANPKKSTDTAGCRSSAGASTSGSLLGFCCFFRIKPYKNFPDLPFERDFFVLAARKTKLAWFLLIYRC
jgi:hypothetical protein